MESRVNYLECMLDQVGFVCQLVQYPRQMRERGGGEGNKIKIKKTIAREIHVTRPQVTHWGIRTFYRG